MRVRLFAVVALCASVVLGAQEDSSPADERDLPLDPERTFSLDTDEGTWISVDVSPNGDTVVFDLLGDLYTMPLTGGEAVSLTDGMPYDNQPRYSPDGSEVVFVSDRDGSENLWLIDIASRETRQLTNGSTKSYESPEWLPDGNYVVAATAENMAVRGDARNPKLWMWHVDGGTGVQIIKEPGSRRITGPTPTPDGRHIWFAQRTNLWQYNAILPQYQLAVYDRETGEQYTRSSRYGSAFRPTVSPDGAWLVYGTRHEEHTGLRLRELATGEERWLAYPVTRDDQESVASSDVLPGMSFTPDSTEVVVSYGGKIWRVPIAEGSEPIAVPFRVQTELEIGPELAFKYPVSNERRFTVRQIRDAVPSPDGSQVGFAALDRLYVVSLPDGEPRRLTPLEVVEAQPTWSPDGEWVAFVTWSPDGGHLYKTRVDGSEAPTQLTTTSAIYQNPAWSPEGDRIVAIQGPSRVMQEAAGPFASGASQNIVSVPSAGGAWTMIAPTDGRRAPHFTSDADRIFLYHSEDGLVSIRWDGTDEQAHVKVTGSTETGRPEPVRASVVLMSPSGERAFAQVDNNLYVLEVPVIGGDTPTVSVANPESAVVPVRQLTEVGGQFPVWGRDGLVHWSIGNAHFIYDIDDARAADAARTEAESAGQSEDDDESEDDGYLATEIRITVDAQRDFPDGFGVLRGGRVVTMRGNQIIENADLIVQGNRILDIGRRGTVQFPDFARIFDVSGTTIVPGFVDTHAHMRPTFGVHKAQPWAYLANLAYGVTTTRDPQTGTTDVLTYGDLVETGTIVGPRIYSTGPGVFSAEQIKDLDHARDVLSRYSDYYDTKTIKMYTSGNRQQRQWILMAAREQELLPTTEGALDMKYNMEMMLDGYPGQEHSFPIFPIYNDVVELTAKTGLAYTPTLLVSYGGPFGENYFYTRENPHDDPKLGRFTPHAVLDGSTRRRGAGVGPGPGGWFREEEHVFDDHAKGVKAIVEAGGRVGVGSHGQLQGLGYHWELWAMQSGGLSEHDALRTATILGAESIGLDGDLGTIEPGKLADLVILEENPLDDIRHTNTIRYVMKNGRLYYGDTLNERWPDERTLEITWQSDEPDDLPAGIRD
ncbi:MAG: amidohydrolase family protein [Vicinamibacterales bacterium]